MAVPHPFSCLFRYVGLLTASMLLMSGCVRFRQAMLYTGEEPPPRTERPRKLSLAVEPIIFEDNGTNVWFMDDEDCTQGSVTSDAAYEGKYAIEVSWNRNAAGCEWAGLGIGWDDWVGKDVSEVLPFAAVEMMVRSWKGTMYSLPVVLTLEDYSGGMAFAYTGNRFFERPVIDQDWQKVVVPLSSFDTETENLDPTNVKQLMFELQQSGHIYLDDIRLVFYEEQQQQPWLVEAPRPDPTALPIQLFGDTFVNDNGWGLVRDPCQSIGLTKADPSTGEAAIHLQWSLEPEDCYEAAMGVSWNHWYPVDMTSTVRRAALQFDVRLPSGPATDLPLRIGLQDYAGNFSGVSLDGRFTDAGRFTAKWQTVTVPLVELAGNADTGNIKQLVVYLDEKGDLFIDDIRLVEIF